MIPNIQILRAMAAIMVVFHHSLSGTGHYGTPSLLFEPLSAIGQSGVDLFFVISGFVMVVSNDKSPKSPRDFLLGRFRRIVPIYWILTLAFAGMLVMAGKISTSGEFWHLFLSLAFGSQVFAGVYPVLFLGWTLEYEMFFYATFAAGLALPLRNGTLILPPFVIILLSLIFPVAIALEFVAGMLVAHLYLAGFGSRLTGSLALTTGIILLLASISHPQALDLRWILWGIPAALIVYGAIFVGQLRISTLNFLGDASYSIYLIQVITVTMAFKVLLWLVPSLAPEIHVLISTLATVLLGSIMYVAVERPLLKTLLRP